MPGRSLFTLAIGLGTAVLGGCGEEAPKSDKAAARSGLIKSEETRDWIQLNDHIQPEIWLAERSIATRSEDPKAVRAALETAAEHFHEPVRMIANRAAQLEAMLAPLGAKDDAAVPLVRRLTAVAGTSRPAEGFGSVGQQYYNLRMAGLNGDDAMADLAKHYGTHD